MMMLTKYKRTSMQEVFLRIL